MSASSRPSQSPAWREGDPVLLREIFRGRLWTARPATMAAVRDDLVTVYLAPGTIFKVPADTSRDGILERLALGWELRHHEWTRGRTLHLRPGVAHAIHLWRLPPDWRFGGCTSTSRSRYDPARLDSTSWTMCSTSSSIRICRGAGRTKCSPTSTLRTLNAATVG